MAVEQIFLLALLVGVFFLFVFGPWRYDVVAFSALIVATVAGSVPYAEAFVGFGHPATITVAMVLIISRALQNSGAVDLIAQRFLPPLASDSGHVGLLSSIAGCLSAVMNNVGALALLMPAAIQSAAKAKRSPAIILMPLSFGSILGGLVTLIGTPPNIIVAAFRGDVAGAPFSMFDFTLVGGVVAVSGILFVSVVGWRLIPPSRKTVLSERDLFQIENYVSEARIDEGSQAIGMTLSKLDDLAEEHDAVILGLIRRGHRVDPAGRREEIRKGDRLVVEVRPDSFDALLDNLDLKAAGAGKEEQKLLNVDDIALTEAVVGPGARIIGRAAGDLHLRSRYGVNLLAVSRQGRPYRGRLKAFCFRSGDILLLEGAVDRLPEVIAALGCLPLAERGLQRGRRHLAEISIGVFSAAILAATFGLVALPIALAVAAAIMVILNIIPPREIYDSVDWPVVVLLGAMIPVGQALEASGTTALIADALVGLSAGFPAAVVLTLVLVITMTLSDIINNAATAVVMAPISVNVAGQLGVNADPFLMAVAIGASCAFLTPIGHQNNTLILGPGGYHFGDYWRMGLPLEVLIVAVSLPMLLWVWPL